MRKVYLPLHTLMNKGELVSDMDVNLFKKEADSFVINERGEHVAQMFFGKRNQMYMEVLTNNLWVPYIGEINYYLYNEEFYRFDKIDKSLFVLKFYEITIAEAKKEIEEKKITAEFNYGLKKIMAAQEQEEQQKEQEANSQANINVDVQKLVYEPNKQNQEYF